MVGAAGELKPDAIVLDIAMPVLDGLDAGRKVKEMLPAVQTGLSDHESRCGCGRRSFSLRSIPAQRQSCAMFGLPLSQLTVFSSAFKS